MSSTLVQNNHIHKKNKQEVLLVDGSGCPEISNSSFFYKIMEGIFIPMEILEVEEINNTEKMVLSIYRYYTVNGDLHCCTLKNEDICKTVQLKDESNLRRIKKHLKELGFIRTDGGIKVTYLGVKEDKNVLHKEDLNVPQGGQISPKGRTNKSKREDKNVPHKEEERNKKRIKKVMTNFDLLLNRLPSYYKTPERIDYIKDKYEEMINNKDIIDIESWFINIRNELNTVYPIEYKAEKKKPISNTIDVL